MKQKLLLAFLCIGLLTIYFACEKDDSVVKEEQTFGSLPTQITPTLKTVSYENAGEAFNRLKTELQIGPYFQLEQNDGVLSRSTQDTLGFTIYTDIIKEVIAGNYLSYTMLILTPDTSDSKFYNLTIEDKNGEADMFISKYVPSAEWLEDKSKAFKGSISVYRVDSFEAVPIDDGGGTNDDHYPSTDPQGSPNYPTDCNGYVIVNIEQIPYQCTCADHWPWDVECDCPSYGGLAPGYNNETYYICVEDNSGSSDNGTTDSNGNNTGGGTTNNDNTNSDDGTSIASTVTNDEVPCEPPYSEWDIDHNCRLDNVEICKRDYPNDPYICDCVSQGNELAFCVEDEQRRKRCNQLQDIAVNGNFSDRMQELINNTSGNTEILYYGIRDGNDEMDYSNQNRIESSANVHGIPGHSLNNSIDSAMHNHFLGDLPIFSSGDLNSLWVWFDGSAIVNTNTFIMYVATTGLSNSTTDDDTLYALVISDVAKFQTKGALYLRDEVLLASYFYEKGIVQNIAVDLNEKRFLEFITDKKLGLTLYKGDRDDLTNWKQLKLKNDNTIQIKDCN